MIYLDNAATTYPKPQVVREAVAAAMQKYGANPGRSGHTMAMETAGMVYACRKKAAKLFDADVPENVIFTPSCTAAINTVLKGLLQPGDHVVVSDLEHNALMRPLEGLKSAGITWTAAHVTPFDNDATVDAFRKAICANTKLVFCTHASNVFGVRLPIERLAALAHAYGAFIAVDAAQSAGVLPLHVQADHLDFICAAGHKGLYGPMGTGLLITDKGHLLKPFCEGGTGSFSHLLTQPKDMPDRFESGTLNAPGIAGLSRGLDVVLRKTPEKIHLEETKLLQWLYRHLQRIHGVKLYLPMPDGAYTAPVLSFNIDGFSSEDVGAALNKKGIAVRCGLHCAPIAHRTFGTESTGTVRVSPSMYNTGQDMAMLVQAVENLVAYFKKM